MRLTRPRLLRYWFSENSAGRLPRRAPFQHQLSSLTEMFDDSTPPFAVQASTCISHGAQGATCVIGSNCASARLRPVSLHGNSSSVLPENFIRNPREIEKRDFTHSRFPHNETRADVM